MRRIILFAAAGAFALAPLAPAAASAGHHRRVSQDQLCHLPQDDRCLRLQNNEGGTLNDPVNSGNDTPGPAENSEPVQVSGTYQGWQEYVIEWTSYPGMCVGINATNEEYVLNKNCSGPDPGAFGTVWALNTNNDKIISVPLSKAAGGNPDFYLTTEPIGLPDEVLTSQDEQAISWIQGSGPMIRA